PSCAIQTDNAVNIAPRTCDEDGRISLLYLPYNLIFHGLLIWKRCGMTIVKRCTLHEHDIRPLYSPNNMIIDMAFPAMAAKIACIKDALSTHVDQNTARSKSRMIHQESRYFERTNCEGLAWLICGAASDTANSHRLGVEHVTNTDQAFRRLA